ncbi:MAG: hypothetical protein V4526_02220 [Patescibacteria group bacterium]
MFDTNELIKKYRALKIYDQMEEIGKKHHLHIDQIGILDSETRALVVGVTPRESFIKELAKGLEISMGQAELIAQDVNTRIMLPLRESLKNDVVTLESKAEKDDQIPSMTISHDEQPVSITQVPQKSEALAELESPEVIKTKVNVLPSNPTAFEQKLLSSPVTTSANVEVSQVNTTVPVPPPAPPAPPKPSFTSDPYREAIK